MKNITTAQLAQIGKMANEKGLERQIFRTHLLDNGTMSRVLDAVKEGLPITVGTPLIPPIGGRIVTLKVKVQLDREWQEAVNAAGPDTPPDYNVRKVGDLYLPTGAGIVEEELVLLNYTNGGSWEKALAWAEQSRLWRTDPRRVFAVGEGQPRFNYEVGPNSTYVIATKECAFDGESQTCGVWWIVSKREAYLRWVDGCGGGSAWFAFRK